MDKQPGKRPWARAFLLAAGLAGALGCNDQVEANDELLDELERLTFVPAGQMRRDAFYRAELTARTDVPLLVDRFEVTFGDLARTGLTDREDRPWAGDSGDGSAIASWPADLGFAEAGAYAESRGMRLPTPGEWLYIASGNLGHRYPWGYNSQESVANTLDLAMERPLAVGTFEAGRGPFGTYDQIGNVWEWTTGWVPGIGDPVGIAAGVDFDAGGLLEAGPYLSAMGGSYTSRQRPLFVEGGIADVPLSFYSKTLTRGHRAVDVGARCVADAESYLAELAPRLGRGKATRARLRDIGDDWFSTGESELIALLEDLIEKQGTGTGLDDLLEGARP